MFLERILQPEIIKRLHHYPVVGIIGSRQIGKTTLVKQMIPHIDKDTIYLDLESIADFQKLENPELYFQQHIDKCVIVDEIQNKPDLFPILRSVIDKDRIPGRFIILGSASPYLLRQSSESLAGRISYLQLHPMNLNEVSEKVDMFGHWFKGGYPLSLLNPDQEISNLWLDDFINSYIQRDLPALGLSSNPILTRRLWIMLSHLNGQILNYSDIGRSLQISSPSVKNYIDYFENSFLIKRLEPFFINIKKRIVKSPKIYLTDTGILHRLLNITDFEGLQAYPMIGYSWEGYVFNQLMTLLNPGIELHFYRTKDGSEVDLVFVKGLQPIATAEIKYTSTPSLSAGNTRAINTLGADNNFVITPASEDYLMRENVRVCSLPEFLSKYLPAIQ
jgi:predicted AAA+ superfamily ATPase